MKINRYGFLIKAPNRAKLGADAPRDGFVQVWNEDVAEPDTEEETDMLFDNMAREKEQAYADAEAWLGYRLPGDPRPLPLSKKAKALIESGENPEALVHLIGDDGLSWPLEPETYYSGSYTERYWRLAEIADGCLDGDHV